MGRPRTAPPNAVSFLLRLPPELLQDLRTYAGSKSKSLNEVIWKALAAWFETLPEKDAVIALRMASSAGTPSKNPARRRKTRR